MSSGWIKYLPGNSGFIQGTDEMVDARQVSFSQSHTYMLGLESSDRNLKMSIFGQMWTEFWQSDDFEVNILDIKPRRVARRIQRKFRLDEDCFFVQEEKDSIYLKVGQADISNKLCILIEEKDKGKWLTVELDIEKREFRFYISENKI